MWNAGFTKSLAVDIKGALLKRKTPFAVPVPFPVFCSEKPTMALPQKLGQDNSACLGASNSKHGEITYLSELPSYVQCAGQRPSICRNYAPHYGIHGQSNPRFCAKENTKPFKQKPTVCCCPLSLWQGKPWNRLSDCTSEGILDGVT